MRFCDFACFSGEFCLAYTSPLYINITAVVYPAYCNPSPTLYELCDDLQNLIFEGKWDKLLLFRIQLYSMLKVEIHD